MAISPFKPPGSSSNRSRSSSCSSPIRNRLIYQEIYSLGTDALLRSYSCDQVFNKDASGRTFQTTQIQISSFITPIKKKPAKLLETEPKEPSRLALEFHSEKSVMKKRKAKKIKQVKVYADGLRSAIMFSILSVFSALAFYYYLTYRECNYVWDLEKTEFELKEKVFGQDEAVAKINSVIKTSNSTRDIHTMVLTGGVGVGKTYASSIISKNFPWASNKLITYSGYFAADVDKLLQQKFSTCGCNLVIIDDLPVKAAKEVINLTVLLKSNHKENVNLLIILIFQIRSEFDRSEIINEFKNTFINFYHVPFKHLTEDAVEKCFNAEIQKQGVEISNSELKKLIEDKMKHIDIVGGPVGCKGIADEVTSFFKKRS